MTPNKDYIVFLDLETTGLDIQHDQILELGMLVVDVATLTVRETYSSPVVPSLNWEERLAANPEAYAMHSINGLIEDVNNKGKPLEKVVHNVHKILAKFSSGKDVDIFRLAGTGVAAFDLPLLKCQVPELAEVFHFRTLDVAVFKQWYDLYGPGIHYSGQGSKHRALDDCRTSLETARKIKELL